MIAKSHSRKQKDFNMVLIEEYIFILFYPWNPVKWSKICLCVYLRKPFKDNSIIFGDRMDLTIINAFVSASNQILAP